MAFGATNPFRHLFGVDHAVSFVGLIQRTRPGKKGVLHYGMLRTGTLCRLDSPLSWRISVLGLGNNLFFYASFGVGWSSMGFQQGDLVDQ